MSFYIGSGFQSVTKVCLLHLLWEAINPHDSGIKTQTMLSANRGKDISSAAKAVTWQWKKSFEQRIPQVFWEVKQKWIIAIHCSSNTENTEILLTFVSSIIISVLMVTIFFLIYLALTILWLNLCIFICFWNIHLSSA